MSAYPQSPITISAKTYKKNKQKCSKNLSKYHFGSLPYKDDEVGGKQQVFGNVLDPRIHAHFEGCLGWLFGDLLTSTEVRMEQLELCEDRLLPSLTGLCYAPLLEMLTQVAELKEGRNQFG